MPDLDGRCFVKRGGALIPADFAAEELLASLHEGREVILTVRKARSPAHHRWFFALLRKVVDNTDNRWADEEDLLDDLKLAVGHVSRRTNLLTGEVCLVAKSINFASMTEHPFRRFRDRCVYVLGRVLGVDPLTLMAETNATQPLQRESA